VFELGNDAVSALGFLFGAMREEEEDSGDDQSDAEKREHTDFEDALKGESVAGHFFSDREGLESGLRHAKAFFGNAAFVFEVFQGVLLADLRADAREDFGFVPREGEDVVGAKVKGAGAIGGATGRHYKETGIGMLGLGDGDSFIAEAAAGEN
jgi:hypothetical protein